MSKPAEMSMEMDAEVGEGGKLWLSWITPQGRLSGMKMSASDRDIPVIDACFSGLKNNEHRPVTIKVTLGNSVHG